ncbi:MAG: amidohydrolase family protein [Actinomycetia bacterium]|nr:amidohydrolase family protein [Actinomycetes bacterium]
MSADLIFRNATVYPGEGAPRRADVAVAGGSITSVDAALPQTEAAEVVDGEGLILCPGFIDMHAHSALRTHDDPLLTPKILQGYTTELIGPDGLAPAPVAADRRGERQAYLRGLEGAGPEQWSWSTFDEYLDWLEGTRPALTLVPSIGHNSVRDRVMGGDRRAPTATELAAMRKEVRIGLENGARALSFGLIYLPGTYAETDELVALAEEAAAFGAPLVPHIRNEGIAVLDGLAEMIDVARRSVAPLHVSHLKSRTDEALIDGMLKLLEEASAELSISFDQYPWGAGSTVLAALLPPWAQEGGASGTLARLRDRDARARMAEDMQVETPEFEGIYASLGPDRVVIANAAPPNDGVVGRTLSQIALERGVEGYTAAFDLLLESELDMTMISHYATDEAVRKIAAHPLQLVGSDAIFGAKPHPRLYATTPRFLGRYAIQDGLVPVEEAVARLTARAADRIGLPDRGRIAPGKRADLALLDPTQFRDEATFDEPAQSPRGLAGVWVAGQAVVRDGRVTGARPGGVIRTPFPGSG